ncbi:MAG: hypothetical protein R3C53_27070 [Pirellulaceae bacterium]
MNELGQTGMNWGLICGCVLASILPTSLVSAQQTQTATEKILAQVAKALNNSADRRTRNYGAYLVASQMANRGETEFAVAFLTAYLQDGLEVGIPVEWKQLLAKYFRERREMAPKYFDPEQISEYRFVANHIVGPEGTFATPPGFVIRKEPLFAASNESNLVVVGIQEKGLSQMLMYSRESKRLVRIVELQHTEHQVSGSPPDPLTEDAVVYIEPLRGKNGFAVFSVVRRQFAVEIVSLEDLITYFSMNDFPLLK